MQRGKNLKFLSSHPALHNDYVTQQVLESEPDFPPGLRVQVLYGRSRSLESYIF